MTTSWWAEHTTRNRPRAHGVERWWVKALADALIATYPPVYDPGCPDG